MLGGRLRRGENMNKVTENNFIEFIYSDDAVFHFTTIKKALESICYTGTLRINKLYNTNDPQEYKHWTIGSTTDYSANSIRKVKELEILINRLKENTYISCFTGNDTKKFKYGYQRARMWSQYGEEHKGICLVFSKSDIEFFVKKKYSDIDVVECDNVRYRNSQLINGNAFIINKKNFCIKNNEKVALNHIRNNIKSIYFSKCKDYENENEYRIVLIDKDSKDPYKEIPILGLLRGILFGDRTPSIYEEMGPYLYKNYKVDVLSCTSKNGAIIISNQIKNA